MRILLLTGVFMAVQAAVCANQTFICPAPERISLVELASGTESHHEFAARVEGNWIADDPAAARLAPPEAGTGNARDRPSISVTTLRPRAAPMLTHAGSLSVTGLEAGRADSERISSVLPASEWLQAKMVYQSENAVFLVECVYGIRNNLHSMPTATPGVEAAITVNRRECELSSRAWRGRECSRSRTACEFSCGETPILEE